MRRFVLKNGQIKKQTKFKETLQVTSGNDACGTLYARRKKFHYLWWAMDTKFGTLVCNRLISGQMKSFTKNSKIHSFPSICLRVPLIFSNFAGKCMRVEPRRYLCECWGYGPEMKTSQSSRAHENKKVIIWWWFCSVWKWRVEPMQTHNQNSGKQNLDGRWKQLLQVSISFVEPFSTFPLKPWFHLRR